MAIVRMQVWSIPFEPMMILHPHSARAHRIDEKDAIQIK